MSWNDDSWRDSYDAWKLASPDDEREPEECYHEEFEIDWEGRSHCDRCGEAWWASADEIRFQREQQAEYDAWCRRQERREFWRRFTRPIRWPIYRLLERVWPRKACSVLLDEEIPF
jgi:hypothetical protein